VNELHLIEWTHPRLGRISEVACAEHEGHILAALRTLGIGCSGELTHAPGATCLRCLHSGEPPRQFLRG
jgi:hypothetical protein